MAEESGAPAGAGGLQFDRAEVAGALAVTCAGCGAGIADAYWGINGKVFCGRCRDGVKAALTGGSGLARFLKAAAFGTAAAVVGAGIYYGVAASTGIEFGLIAIVVGFMVGFAVRSGSGGRGGWLYQALAMFLTYSAIAATYAAQVVEAIRKEPPAATAPAATPGGAAEAKAPAVPEEPASPAKFLAAIVFLIALAYALPFLAGVENLMGIVIIAIGLYEAWKINRRVVVEISGPHPVAAPAGPPPAPSA